MELKVGRVLRGNAGNWVVAGEPTYTWPGEDPVPLATTQFPIYGTLWVSSMQYMVIYKWAPSK